MLENIINIKNISIGDLAKALGCSRGTIYNRIEHPGTLNINEVKILSRELGVLQKDLIDIICGSRSTYKRVISKL